MADPFADLRPLAAPAAPDPVFAGRLRSQLEQTLFSRGDSMSTQQLSDDPPAVTTPGVVAYLIVGDARRALDWYAEAFGARLRGEPMVMDDGRIGHSELEVAGSVIYVADDPSELASVAAPDPGRGATVSLVATIGDVDAVVARSTAAGAELERPAADHAYGRNAVIRDPFGHRWMLSGDPVGSAAPELEQARHGDVGYVSLWVSDDALSAEFFASVLGWRYTPAADHARLRDGGVPAQGLVGAAALETAGHHLGDPTAYLSFVVDDVDAAVERVRAAGGTAADPSDTPYGRSAECSDDQGMEFALHQAGPGEPRPGSKGTGHGDVVYLTIEVVDGARARAFYGSVLGWTYAPGSVPDGRQVIGTAPMIGMRGGQDRATVVPSYMVDDIIAAVVRVRAGGGTSTEPEDQPYGRTVNCTDPSGMRYNLHQM
ncbi:MAG: VOC family protein [Actinomycetota bacterium]|nr:VOC family protein [Actinomycetota bacterium]